MEKLTIEKLQSLVKSTGYFNLEDTTTTICALETLSGFIIIGKSACLNIEDFDAEIGKKIAYDNAIEQLWELEGYYINKVNYKETPTPLITLNTK
jgi:hypothetical protein